MPTNTNMNESRDADRNAAKPENVVQVKLDDLDVAISLLSRMKGEVASMALAQLRNEVATATPKIVAEEISKSGMVRGILAEEMGRRTKALFAWMGAIGLMVGFMGFKSLESLVDRQVQAATQDEVKQQVDAQRRDLEKQLTHIQDRAWELQKKADESALAAC